MPTKHLFTTMDEFMQAQVKWWINSQYPGPMDSPFFHKEFVAPASLPAIFLHEYIYSDGEIVGYSGMWIYPSDFKAT